MVERTVAKRGPAAPEVGGEGGTTGASVVVGAMGALVGEGTGAFVGSGAFVGGEPGASVGEGVISRQPVSVECVHSVILRLHQNPAGHWVSV